MSASQTHGLLHALFAEADNARVLGYLGLRSPDDVVVFRVGTEGSPFDEGGQLFFHKCGREVPAAARWELGTHNLMVHERTARIFAIHEGRLTIALRPHPRWGLLEFGSLRGETLDGPVDLSALGAGWTLYEEGFGDATAADFLAAYTFAGEV